MSVPDFIAALDEYRAAERDQHLSLATREPRDLGAADRRVRQTLKQLIEEINAEE